MKGPCSGPISDPAGMQSTRFNALRHGVLSRYTVLPWEDADEYGALVASLVAEHRPQGPTEEHLVEELAGVLWRKRRLRFAEAAAHRRELENSFPSTAAPPRRRWLTSRGQTRARKSAKRSALRRKTPKRSFATSMTTRP
jgi:hypothetical protein